MFSDIVIVIIHFAVSDISEFRIIKHILIFVVRKKNRRLPKQFGAIVNLTTAVIHIIDYIMNVLLSGEARIIISNIG